MSDTSVHELLLWLHQGGSTCMLRVGAGLEAAIVFFREGSLYRCEWGSLQGEAAVEALCAVHEGTFCLISRQFPEPRGNVRMPTPTLLAALAPEPQSDGVRAAG